MKDIDEVIAQIKKIYRPYRHEAADVPLRQLAELYYLNAGDYLESAQILHQCETAHHRTIMPWYQLMGQALELSMKACLAAAGINPPRTHDLITLCKQIEEAGFRLKTEHAYANLIHLNHGYYDDFATG
ncbi:HEPN domain-containing protein, partial [Tautonia marina]|uniref:HEPN domain-containing protein n=1 Tax=Tautonia marina TaxID=2653855 RepID=UPI001375F470